MRNIRKNQASCEVYEDKTVRVSSAIAYVYSHMFVYLLMLMSMLIYVVDFFVLSFVLPCVYVAS